MSTYNEPGHKSTDSSIDDQPIGERTADADIIAGVREHVAETLTDLEEEVRSGEDLSHDDLLSVHRSLNSSTDEVCNAVNRHVEDDGPAIVEELRDLASGASGSLLSAAFYLNRGKQMSPGLYEYAGADLAWAFAVFELLGESGAVRPAGVSCGDVDPADLSGVVDAVEAAEDVAIVHTEESRALLTDGGDDVDE